MTITLCASNGCMQKKCLKIKAQGGLCRDKHWKLWERKAAYLSFRSPGVNMKCRFLRKNFHCIVDNKRTKELWFALNEAISNKIILQLTDIKSYKNN